MNQRQKKCINVKAKENISKLFNHNVNEEFELHYEAASCDADVGSNCKLFNNILTKTH